MNSKTETSNILASVVSETREIWRALPNRWLFVGVLVAWTLLFHVLGNITFGYVKTASLFEWMYYVFSTNPDDEHGMYMPLIVLGLFWWKRKEFQGVVKDIWLPALVIILAASALHILGFMVQQTRISIVAFFLGIYGLLGLVWGREFLKKSFFPMFLFVFCVPIGTEAERVTFPLRVLSTQITSGVADGVFGIQVIRDGTRLFDAAGRYQYEVAAACSGIRSLTAIFIFTTIYSFVSFKGSGSRMLLIFATLPLAVVSNVVRLMMIIFAAEFFGESAGTYVHDSSWLSMLPYVPSLLVIVLFGQWLKGRDAKKSDSHPVAEPTLIPAEK